MGLVGCRRAPACAGRFLAGAFFFARRASAIAWSWMSRWRSAVALAPVRAVAVFAMVFAAFFVGFFVVRATVRVAAFVFAMVPASAGCLPATLRRCALARRGPGVEAASTELGQRLLEGVEARPGVLAQAGGALPRGCEVECGRAVHATEVLPADRHRHRC